MKQILANVRKFSPLVHCITNYVTVNDCANIILACGASPVMADDEREVEEIAAVSGALVINIGTLNARTCKSMIVAGKKANELGVPVVFDPVGVGATAFRRDFSRRFLTQVHADVIRGNVSEIKQLANSDGFSRGVDACAEDKVTDDNLDTAISFIKNFARSMQSVIAVTGAIDIVCDCDKAIVIRGGNPMMARVTGTGCQLTALTAAFVAANQEQILEAAAAAVCTMDLAGEIAAERLSEHDGNASYRNYIIDAVSRMTPEKLYEGMKYDVR